MATGTLTGQTIANTYKSLLKITGTTAGGETLHATTQKVIEDGDGNPFPLSAATDALMITSTNRLEFGDDASYIHQSADGVLDLVSDTEIELNATTIDINGAVDISGNVGIGGSPSQLLDLHGASGTSPMIKIRNTDNEDNDTGRESTLRFSGLRSGNEAVDNAQISAHHDGSADDDAGMLIFWTNLEGTGLTEKLRINAEGKHTISANNNGDYGLFVNNGHATGWGLRVAAGTDNGDYIIRGQNENGDDKFIVTSAGELGINKIPSSSFEFDMAPTAGNANFRMAATATNQGSRMSLQAHSGDKNQIEFCDSSDQAQKGAIDSNVGSGEMIISSTGDIKLSCGGTHSVYSLGAGGTTNTAFGKGAGSALNGSSNYNVLLGYESGLSMTSANSNVSIGYRAMDAVTSAGNNNIGIGVNVFTNLTGGDENVGIGDSVGIAMTDTSDCVLIGSGAGIAINNTDADGTVAIGQQALNALTEGNKNLAIGFQSLHDVAGGDGNMGIGYQAGASLGRAESNNIAIGNGAMLSSKENASSSSVDNNIAIGVDAMTGGELGSSANFLRNIAIGNNALNSTGSHGNTGLLAIGYDALTANTTGAGNTAIGYLSGQSISSTSQNTLLGYNAGQACASNRNTLIGYQAGVSINSGNDNVCVGNAAGDALQDANGAVIIGHNSDAASNSNYANVIGHNITGGATQRSMIGAGSNFVELDHSTSGNNWANTSDVRIKESIVDSDLGLDFVNKLRAVKYEEKAKKDWPQEFLSTSGSEDLEEKNQKVFDGFIAQEVKAIVDESKTTFSAWQIDENNKKQQLQYAMFVVPLVKAVQELSAKVTELENKLGE